MWTQLTPTSLKLLRLLSSSFSTLEMTWEFLCSVRWRPQHIFLTFEISPESSYLYLHGWPLLGVSSLPGAGLSLGIFQWCPCPVPSLPRPYMFQIVAGEQSVVDLIATSGLPQASGLPWASSRPPRVARMFCHPSRVSPQTEKGERILPFTCLGVPREGREVAPSLSCHQ